MLESALEAVVKEREKAEEQLSALQALEAQMRSMLNGSSTPATSWESTKGKPKRQLSAAARASIAAAQRKRWAAWKRNR